MLDSGFIECKILSPLNEKRTLFAPNYNAKGNLKYNNYFLLASVITAMLKVVITSVSIFCLDGKSENVETAKGHLQELADKEFNPDQDNQDLLYFYTAEVCIFSTKHFLS